MTIWTNEIKELDTLYESFKGHLPDIVNELEQLIHTQDANVVMLYSRRCLEVIITDLCEVELKRPRKTEPLKGIIDKLNSEEKVPSHIITSMQSLNSMATYGTHPKDFDPEQVKPVLINLAIIIKWYLKYKDFQIVSKTKPEEEMPVSKGQGSSEKVTPKPKKRKILLYSGLVLGIVIIAFVVFNFISGGNKNRVNDIYSVDNIKYKEVIIGNHVWMAENLRTTLFNDGTVIPMVKNKSKWRNLKTPAYCWYDNNEATYKSTYGALYNWYAVNTGKLCPTGWHVPEDYEWISLADYLGGDNVLIYTIAGIKLKEAGNTHWKFMDSINATNESSFTALPGGFRSSEGLFSSIGEKGGWWSSTAELETNWARYRELNYWDENLFEGQHYKQTGESVRCVKDLIIADYDNNNYKTVQIGEQVWMAENLKTTRFNDGTPIPMVTDKNEWANLKTPAYCWNNNDKASYKSTYGALYNWYVVNSGKLCPTGWHVPGDSEWETLTTHLGGESVAGDKLKEIGTVHWNSSNTKTTNYTTGFTALPGGHRFGGSYMSIGYVGHWWSFTEESSFSAWSRGIYYNSGKVTRDDFTKEDGISVRCVKD